MKIITLICRAINIARDAIYDIYIGHSFIYFNKNFNKKSTSYAYAPNPTHLSILNAVANEILKKCNPESILDVGCGHGRALGFFARKFKCQVDGIELIEDLAQKAKVYNKARKNVTVFHGNAIEIDSGNSYDLIFLFNPFPDSIFFKFINRVKTKKQFCIVILNCSYVEVITKILSRFIEGVDRKEIKYCGISVNLAIFSMMELRGEI